MVNFNSKALNISFLFLWVCFVNILSFFLFIVSNVIYDISRYWMEQYFILLLRMYEEELFSNLLFTLVFPGV